MSKKKTNEQFLKEISVLTGDEYLFLEPYIGNKYPIKVRHNTCGHEYEVRPDNFLRRARCPVCSRKIHYLKIKKTDEQFKKEVYDLVKDEYTVLGKYINSQTKIKIRHDKCGNIVNIKPSAFLSDPRCKKCYRKKTNSKNRTKTTEQFKQEVFNIVGNEYTVLGEYIKNNVKIKMRHNKCGYEWKVTPGSFLSGNRCPKCSNRLNTGRNTKRKTTEQFKQKVKELVGNEYIVLGKYKNNKTKIKIKHITCGNMYEVTPNDFIKGTRCPYCKASKGEQKIADFLIKNKIKFETEKEFGGLVHLRPLRFDFYLPTHNLLIEYDGIQHYEPVDFSGNNQDIANENLKINQERDKIKNNYCKENNINLLRIKYTDFKNINKILKEELK